ncbi:glycosyltransferase [Cetobacterium sp.]|uniref:glycosyltransferase n=1 Tax=Cetobacterium sp. TaxID=2071632 RepID=UPI003F412657
MKKIGILVPYLKNNGIGRVAANMSNMFVKNGYSVKLILNSKVVDFNFSGEIIDLKLNFNKETNCFIKLKETILWIKKIKKIKKQENFDVVISLGARSDLVNILTKEKEKVFTTLHTNIEENYNKLYRMLYYLNIKYSDKVIVVSKYFEKYLKNKYQKFQQKVVCIKNSIDIELINSISLEKLDESLGENYILSVGRLTESKGQKHIVKAFYKLKDEFKDHCLVILGDGNMRSELEKIVENLDLKEQVIFLGFKKNPYKYMRKARLCVSASYFEGFPMFFLEAMATGCPILSTDCISGPREILTEKDISDKLDYSQDFEYGFLVENFLESKNNIEEMLYQKIKDILLDVEKNKKYRDISKKRAEEFSEENIYKQWEKVLK